jgi:hypothetical protein
MDIITQAMFVAIILFIEYSIFKLIYYNNEKTCK